VKVIAGAILASRDSGIKDVTQALLNQSYGVQHRYELYKVDALELANRQLRVEKHALQLKLRQCTNWVEEYSDVENQEKYAKEIKGCLELIDWCGDMETLKAKASWVVDYLHDSLNPDRPLPDPEAKDILF
jgi:hypothetical protein